jgi:polyisoprenoid-binding protein YceI
MIYFLLRLLLALASALLLNVAHAGWEIDPSHTHVSFEVSHLGVSNTPGIFRKVSAVVNYDDERVEKSNVRFTIDAASIDTVNEQRDSDLRGPDWFDAAKYPHIKFSSTSVKRLDERNFVISGLLTIRDTTLPVEFKAVVTNRAINPFLKIPMTGFVGVATIQRSDFGLKQYPAVIGNVVSLKIVAELLNKP